ncbi:MAG: type I restriction enzyme HsdR N-terminal domain-containing protein [Elusimicrobiota bacterium]|jgi:DNA modification methylase|nr:type I restriction enzyme HsdR N-terminal domain-containing protein [Elusimicrobiota bacterium]
MIKNTIFKKLNIKDKNIKEDTVRELIILPILKKLGYENENIIRSKTLKHPFIKIGSKKRPIKLIPDYVIKIGESFICVLDAKAPNEKIMNSDNVEQVYSYATHPEIRSNYFCLCNGIEFVVYKTLGNSAPILYFKIEEIKENWDKLKKLISPSHFILRDKKKNIIFIDREKNKEFDYLNRPILKEIPIKKWMSKRHYGVHGYFTRQVWNVVAEYIKNFTQKGDIVLDSFGGTGVTCIEAMMNGRKAINVDLNPLAIFLVDALTCPVNIKELGTAFEEVVNEYEKKEPKNKKEVKKILKNNKKYPYPKDIIMPKGSDVEFIEELFSKEQLAKLALLKSIIKKQKNKYIKKVLMLMFSGLITRSNLTYHTSNIGGGNAAPFMYYRYRIAPKPTIIDIMKSFKLRFEKITNAKKEIEYYINKNTIENLKIVKGTATDLNFINDESVDYIYTDPPYGKKIAYLDLSIMWNAWLDLELTEDDYEKEAIEGGNHNKTKDSYKKLITESIKEMYRVLKFDRWLSFVFAHKDPEFWHLITETAEDYGFEYVNAIPQKNGQTSFKKRQNPFTTLSGQLIIKFKKTKNPKAIMKANLGMNMTEIIIQTIEGIIARDGGATLEQINDELIIKGLELGFLDLLAKEYEDLSPFLLNNFDYNKITQQYKIKENTKFRSHIDIHLRIQYYLLSHLRRKEREGKEAKFDEMVLEILPLLKNGQTPEEQTILKVLENIAYKTNNGSWQLKEADGQLKLF